MSYLTKEQLKKAVENAKPLTEEQKTKMTEVSKKIKVSSYEERRAYRLKQAEDNGHY
jgi:hypothetical protein